MASISRLQLLILWAKFSAGMNRLLSAMENTFSLTVFCELLSTLAQTNGTVI